MSDLPSETHIQGLWFAGRFGALFSTPDGTPVQIIDFGEWNHAAGPDFLDVSVLIGDDLVHGDLELDPTPEDWERHGHSTNPDFNRVVLHVSLKPGTIRQSFIRTSSHRQVPAIQISPETLRQGLDQTKALCSTNPGRCAPEFARLDPGDLLSILETCVLKRREIKRRQFQVTRSHHGHCQAVYEALAETLGYHANRWSLKHLAQRVNPALARSSPLPEALMLGTAGMLPPQTPRGASAEATAYHRQLWDAWWPVRSQLELSSDRALAWQLHGCRPSNHPQRRIATLGLASATLPRLARLAKSPAENYAAIRDLLTSLSHPWWSSHATLFGHPLPAPRKLIGVDRVNELMVNHLLPAHDSRQSRELYQKLAPATLSDRLRRAINRLLVFRPDSPRFLRKSWHHQAILQLASDFCARHPCLTCPMPERLRALTATRATGPSPEY